MNKLSLYKWNGFLRAANLLVNMEDGKLSDFDKQLIIERLVKTGLSDFEISVFSKSNPMPKAVEKIVYDYLDQKGDDNMEVGKLSDFDKELVIERVAKTGFTVSEISDFFIRCQRMLKKIGPDYLDQKGGNS